MAPGRSVVTRRVRSSCAVKESRPPVAAAGALRAKVWSKLVFSAAAVSGARPAQAGVRRPCGGTRMASGRGAGSGAGCGSALARGAGRGGDVRGEGDRAPETKARPPAGGRRSRSGGDGSPAPSAGRAAGCGSRRGPRRGARRGARDVLVRRSRRARRCRSVAPAPRAPFRDGTARRRRTRQRRRPEPPRVLRCVPSQPRLPSRRPATGKEVIPGGRAAGPPSGHGPVARPTTERPRASAGLLARRSSGPHRSSRPCGQ